MSTKKQTPRFKPPKRGAVFRNKAYNTLALYTGHRRVYRHGRGVVTVYRLQAVLETGAARAASYEVSAKTLQRGWEPVDGYLGRWGS